MSKPILGIIGGGQLGSMLATAAKKINIKTVIFCDDPDAPGQKFSDEFIYGKYDNQNSIEKFINSVDIITFEFAEEFIDSVRDALEHLNSIGYNKVGIVEGDDIDNFPTKYHSYDAFLQKMNDIFPTNSGQFFGMVFVTG